MVVAVDRAAPPAAGQLGKAAGAVCSLTGTELALMESVCAHVGELLTRNEDAEAQVPALLRCRLRLGVADAGLDAEREGRGVQRERLATTERLVRGLQGVAASAGLPELVDLVLHPS